MTHALRNLTVLDFSRVLAGPLSTMMLGDFGADVIKVERPHGGDDTRSWGPPFGPDGVATYYQSVNRNKRSLVGDLTDPAVRERILEIADHADVLVENFRPGVMDRLGLGYETLAARNPRLVYCSITGFGRGAGSALPGYDLLVQAVGGLMSITGAPDGEPQKVGVALVDVITGLFATTGILTALRHRDATGRGQLVEVNLLSSLLAALVNQASAFTQAGEVAERMGNAHPSIAPYELYSAADGHLVLAVGNDRQFAALCTALGAPQLAEEPRFATNPQRVAHRGELRRELESRLLGRGVLEWIAKLSEVGVPAGAVNDIEGAFRLAERLGLDPVVSIPDDHGRDIRLPRNPIRLSATPASYRSAPPALAPAGAEVARPEISA
jgi:crotonobetainyl-CoA:carnitine CoA-transferase CaiB-like acyl-CoA transferase